MILDNVYLASRYSRKEEMRKWAAILESFGCRVKSRWLEEKFDPNMSMAELTEETNRAIAVEDLEDIISSDNMIFFAEDMSNQPPRGGRHVEFGYALALNLGLIVIGEKENIFHYLPQVRHFPTMHDFLTAEYGKYE